MFDTFIKNFSTQLSNPLPGQDAQYKMAPGTRQRLTETEIAEYNPKKSAVLILLFPEKNTIKTIFIVRPAYDGVHSGQVAFPGGKVEKYDKTLQNTALRETYEEVGVPTDEINIIGKLTPLYIEPSNFMVHPYVGYCNERPTFVPDKREVEEIIEYDLFNLNNKDILTKKEIMIANTFAMTVPCYVINDQIVWGATAMITSELNQVIENTIGG